MIMSDTRPRQTSILSRGEYLRPTEKVSFSTPRFLPPLPRDSPAQSTWVCPLAVHAGAPADCPGASQSHVATLLRDRHRQDVRRLRRAKRVSDSWRTARLAGRRVSHARLEHQGDALAHRHQRHLSAVQPGHAPSIALAMWRIACSPARAGSGCRRSFFATGPSRPRACSIERIGGRPVYPYQPDAIWEALAITKERDFTYPASSGNDLYRRSLYTFWRRTVGPANMFDTSNRQTCRVRSTTTSTPLHALTTLNDPTWVEAARVLAGRSMKAAAIAMPGSAYAFRRVLCREHHRPRNQGLAPRVRLAAGHLSVR